MFKFRYRVFSEICFKIHLKYEALGFWIFIIKNLLEVLKCEGGNIMVLTFMILPLNISGWLESTIHINLHMFKVYIKSIDMFVCSLSKTVTYFSSSIIFTQRSLQYVSLLFTTKNNSTLYIHIFFVQECVGYFLLNDRWIKGSNSFICITSK